MPQNYSSLRNVSGAAYYNTSTTFSTYFSLPRGTTGQRPDAVSTGSIRYNTTEQGIEQYSGTDWEVFSAQSPIITSVSGVINEDTSNTITVVGANFKLGCIAYVEGAGVANISRAMVTTFISASQITFDSNASNVSFTGGQTYNIKVVNPSGQQTTYNNAGTVDRDPIWVSPANASSINSYDHYTGGEYSTYTSGGTTYRVIKFLAGAGTWTSAVTGSADILVVAGGGGGGVQVGGGGGGGGVVYATSYALTANTGYSWKVGQGGTGGGFYLSTGTNASGVSTYISASNGENSNFASLIAIGGGAGSNHVRAAKKGNNFTALNGAGAAGGSGGGGAGHDGSGAGAGGSSNQTSPSGATGYGYAGGSGNPSNWAGGGGGGAGGAGSNGTANTGGNGGIGRAYDITGTSTYYGGGGGGSWNQQTDAASVTATVLGGGGRGCGDNCKPAFGYDHGEDGQSNTGGGGGGTRDLQQSGGAYVRRAGNGGSGIIVIRYNITLETAPIQVDLDASDPDGTEITYSSSSSLPPGFNLTTDIVGYPSAIANSTTYPLTVTATSNSQSENRTFNIIMNKSLDGSTSARAATSAESIKTLTGTTVNGLYWVSINSVPSLVWCDMNTNDGGWMQAMNINTRDGHIVHYNNTNFWESATTPSSYPSGSAGCCPSIRPDGWSNFYQDYKSIDDGNLWNNFAGSKLLIVVHTNGSYLGWRSWNLNTSTVTKFSQFWTGGSSGVLSNVGTTSIVVYQRKITNAEITKSVGSINANEPLLRNGVDLVCNAYNGSADANRLTVTTSAAAPNSGSANFPVGDNSGGGLGTFYDNSAGGRPECDGQIFGTATWSGGIIGTDHLNGSNYSSWGGTIGSGYNWNSTSGLSYDYAFFIK